MEKYLISVMIPIYNAAEYVHGLYKIFTEQTYKRFEVIFINDMSTDDTLSLLKKCAEEDPRFIVLDRKEKGGTAAKGWEYGLPYCKGDYLFPMSHDDFMDNDFLEKCAARACETGADVIMPNLILYYGADKQIKHGEYPLNCDYESSITPREAFYKSLSWKVHGNSLYKMELVRRIGIKATYYNSCEFCFRRMFLKAEKIVFCNTNFYYRQDNPNAITKTFHYFQVDILTTDILLYEILVEEKYNRDLRKQRLKEITKSYIGWLKTFLFTDMKKDEKKYMRKSMVTSTKKLGKLWIQLIGRLD